MPVAKVRWGATAPKDDDDARHRLLDAAGHCFRTYGVAKTTVAAVAARANVSRATVYRYFADRNELFVAVAARDAARFVTMLHERLAKLPTLSHKVTEGVLTVVREARRNETFLQLLASQGAGASRSAQARLRTVMPAGLQLWRPFLEDARTAGELREGLDLDDAAEWIMRVAVSLSAVHGPAERTEEELRRYLSAFVCPAFTRGNGSSPAPDPGAATGENRGS